MTRVVFTAALQMTTESQLFYERCRVSVHAPRLRAFFERLANDDEAHFALLEEALERLTLQNPTSVVQSLPVRPVRQIWMDTPAFP